MRRRGPAKDLDPRCYRTTQKGASKDRVKKIFCGKLRSEHIGEDLLCPVIGYGKTFKLNDRGKTAKKGSAVICRASLENVPCHRPFKEHDPTTSRCPNGKTFFRKYLCRAAVGNSFSEIEVDLQERIVKMLLSRSADIFSLVRHKGFPKYSRKVTRMAERINAELERVANEKKYYEIDKTAASDEEAQANIGRDSV